MQDGEAKLQVPLRMIARQLAWIQSLILEHLAGIAITKKELNTGAETIGRLIALAERFPSLLGPQKGTIHLLAGRHLVSAQSQIPGRATMTLHCLVWL